PSCEYVWSGFHHEPICPTSASYTFAAGAFMFASSFTTKPVGVTCGADRPNPAANTSTAVAPNKDRRIIPAPRSCSLRGFHLFAVFAEPRFAVAPCTMMECRLSSIDVCCVPFPSFEDRSLQGPAIGKAQLPWQIFHTIHRVEMFGRLLIGLAA